MDMIYNFDWDRKKAITNIKKHKISFENASSIFRDNNAISISDEEHSDREDRWITLGIDEVTRILFVVHTYISVDNDNVNIRIISARKATKKEKQIYLGE